MEGKRGSAKCFAFARSISTKGTRGLDGERCTSPHPDAFWFRLFRGGAAACCCCGVSLRVRKLQGHTMGYGRAKASRHEPKGRGAQQARPNVRGRRKEGWIARLLVFRTRNPRRGDEPRSRSFVSRFSLFWRLGIYLSLALVRILQCCSERHGKEFINKYIN